MDIKPIEPSQPQSLLGPVGAVALIVGIVIGAGIFKTPSMVASISGDVGWILVIWIVGAMVSILVALCYAELCTAYPHVGGDYHFIHGAFGRRTSFLYAWSRAVIINPGSIALLSFVFGDYFTKFWPLGEHSNAVWACAIVVILTLVNIYGLKTSARVQMLLTIFEILGLIIVITAGFASPVASTLPPSLYFSVHPSWPDLGLGLVFVLLTFGGWNESAYVSAELKGGSGTMVRVILTSMGILTAIYLLVNVALLYGLGLGGLSNTRTAASDIVGISFGAWAQKVLALFIAIAALTSINATMVVGARSSFAMARDWLTLSPLGHWKSERGSPTRAYLLQTLISLGLIVLGTQEADGFTAMVEFTAPVFWGFLCLVGLSLFLLRKRDPHRARPFKVPLYPITPALFSIACAYLTYSSLGYAISQNAIHISLFLLLSGLLALFLLEMKENRNYKKDVSGFSKK